VNREYEMNFYLVIPLLTLVALFQSVLLSRVSLWGARPDLMLLIVLLWAMVRSVDEALVWGFIGGLLMDLLSGGPLGGTSLALLAAAFLAGQSWGQDIGSSVVRLLLLALVGAVAYHLVLLIALATGHTVAWGFSLLRVAMPSVLLNVALAPFVRPVLVWLERRTRRETLTR
jgi:rod shape-determining protein MreD